MSAPRPLYLLVTHFAHSQRWNVTLFRSRTAQSGEYLANGDGSLEEALARAGAIAATLVKPGQEVTITTEW